MKLNLTKFYYRPRLFLYKLKLNDFNNKFDLKQSTRGTGIFDKSKEKNNSYLHYKDMTNKDQFDFDSNLDEIFENTNPAEQVDTKDLLNKEVSFDKYIEESNKLFEKLRLAFDQVCKADSKVSINPAPSKFVFSVNVHKLGDYIIAKELETKLITLTSPVSGLFKYKFDEINKQWISIKDSHILNEILMREFCYHSKGLLIIE
jgi:frataxin-like iron-binding protein CyaY